MTTTPTAYDSARTRSFYDNWAAREWGRLGSGLPNRVNFLVHRRFLEEHVAAGDRVLEAGAGPGRFTIELARLGARVTVGDLSDVQLSLNREHVEAEDCAAGVESWQQLDILDLSRFATGSFDKVVCFGGALGHVMDHANDGLRELLRVARPDGLVLLSVTSRHGFLRTYIPEMSVLLGDQALRDALRHAVRTGDATEDVPGIDINSHFFTWEEMVALVAAAGGEVAGASSANFLSTRLDADLEQRLLDGDPAVRATFLEWEYEACRSRGALDAGTHLIVAVKPGPR